MNDLSGGQHVGGEAPFMEIIRKMASRENPDTWVFPYVNQYVNVMFLVCEDCGQSPVVHLGTAIDENIELKLALGVPVEVSRPLLRCPKCLKMFVR